MGAGFCLGEAHSSEDEGGWSLGYGTTLGSEQCEVDKLAELFNGGDA